jgi:hypothetical protein
LTPEWGGWLALQVALYIAWAVGIICFTVFAANAMTKWLRNRVEEARTMK